MVALGKRNLSSCLCQILLNGESRISSGYLDTFGGGGFISNLVAMKLFGVGSFKSGESVTFFHRCISSCDNRLLWYSVPYHFSVSKLALVSNFFETTVTRSNSGFRLSKILSTKSIK